MDFWYVLGIEPTTDEGKIKDAYKAMLKLNHPEDNPEGFKSLRAAYDKAIEYARNPVEEKEENTYDDTPVGRWLKRADDIYSDYNRRIAPKEWEDLLNDDVFFCLDTELDAKEELLAFLMTHHLLPRKIWKILVTAIEVKENKSEYAEKFPMDFLEYVLNNSEYPDSFNYYLFEQHDKGLPYDEYITKYYQFRSEVGEQKLAEAEGTLRILEAMPLTHPYVRITKTHLCFLSDKFEEADRISKELYDNYPDDGNCMLARASYLLQSERYDEACEIYELCKRNDDYSFSARVGIADCYHGKGKFKEAQKLYKELLNEHHYDAYLHYKLTVCNSSLVEKYKKMIKDNPADLDSRIELCWCYYQNNMIEEAYKLIRNQTSDEALSMDLNYLKGRCLIAMQKGRESKKYYEEWIRLFEIYKDIDGEVGKRNRDRQELVYFFLAELSVQEGKYLEALELNSKARQHIQIDKQLIITQNAQILYKLGKIDEALGIFEKVTEESYDNIQAIIGLGDCYKKKGMLREALNYYERALFQIPQLPEGNAKILRLYLDEGYIENAEDQLKRFKESEIDSIGMTFCEALIYREKKEYEKAAELIKKIDEANWKSQEFDLFTCTSRDEYEYERSFILLEAGRITKDEAIADIKKLVAKNKDNVNYVYYLANLYFRNGENKEAEREYKRALKLRPDNLTIMVALANTYRELGDNKKEEDMLKKILQIDPEHPFAHGQLGEIYENRGQCKAALIYYTRQLEIDPSDYYYISRGIMYLELENNKKALEDFKTAWGINDNNPYSYYNYGRTLLRIGKPEEAESYLKKAIKLSSDEPRTIFYIILARCYCRMRDILPDVADRVRNVFDDMEKTFPDNPAVFLNRGKAIRALGYLDEAIECFEKGYKLDKDDRYRFRQEIVLSVMDVTVDEKLSYKYLKKYKKSSEAVKFNTEMYYFGRYFGHIDDEYSYVCKLKADDELVCFNRAVSAKKMLEKCKSDIRKSILTSEVEEYLLRSEEYAEKLTESGSNKLLGLRRQALIWIERENIEKAQEYIEKTEKAPMCDHCLCRECYELYLAKAKLEILKNNKDKALEYVDHALSLCPDDGEIKIIRKQILDM